MTWRRLKFEFYGRIILVFVVYVAWMALPYPREGLNLVMHYVGSILWGPVLMKYIHKYIDFRRLEKLLRIQGFFDD